jgi:hypothetical protein
MPKWEVPACAKRRFVGSRYAGTESSLRHQAVPKTGTITGSALLDKIRDIPNRSRFRSDKNSGETIYYHSGGRYHRKCLRERLSNEYKPLEIRNGLGASGTSACQFLPQSSRSTTQHCFTGEDEERY